MATPYSLLFQSFLGKIESNIYVNMLAADAEADMIVLLNSGIVNFEYPKVNVFDKNDSLQVFNQTLTVWEIEILSNLMKLEWLDRMIFSIDSIKQKMSLPEFKTTSQASHLEALLKIKENTNSLINTLKTKYSYRKSNENVPDFSGLSGDS